MENPVILVAWRLMALVPCVIYMEFFFPQQALQPGLYLDPHMLKQLTVCLLKEGMRTFLVIFNVLSHFIQVVLINVFCTFLLTIFEAFCLY